MLKNYIITAWRNLMKNKVFSFINIFGLAAGLACCMLITLYLLNEWSYDKYHKNSKDLYELGTVFIAEHKAVPWAATPAPMGEAMKREFPEIRETTRLIGLFIFEDKDLLQYNVPGAPLVSLYESNGFLADSTFFRMFTYHFTEGDPATALSNPATVVLSEEIARKMFGNQPALNKVIHVSSNTNGEHNFRVTGVFRPTDAPSHINGRYFLSMTGGDVESFLKRQADDFATNNMFYTYLQLRPGADAKKLEAKFPAFMDKYAAKGLKAMGFDKRQFIIPVKDIHLRSDIVNNIMPPASRTYLYILGSIALFTLLIACINFMNLATARSAKRSAEVGVRKVLGALRKSLILQFLGESVLMSLIAFFVAWMLTALLLPAFGIMTGKTLSLTLPEHLPLMAAFLGLAVLTGLVAGSYPAFYLSAFKPVQVLKGKFTNSLAAVSLRRGLVVFQFVISVSLIISAVVINDQMHYLRSKDLGFEKSGQIIIPLRSETAKKSYAALRNAFADNRQVAGVGGAAYYPGLINPSDDQVYRQGQTVLDAKRTRLNYVDTAYMRTLGLTAVAGRLFSKDFPADTGSRVILNENAVHEMGFASPQDAIGKTVFHEFRGQSFPQQIIGVVKDFHFEDLHLPITPYEFNLSISANYNYMLIRTRTGEPAAGGPGAGGAGQAGSGAGSVSTEGTGTAQTGLSGEQMAELLKSMGKIWHSVDPNEPFEFSFLDEDFQKNYEAEEGLSALIRYFTVMAILISCLGLFGLASFSAEQRFKEIGIRKVLGAGAPGIVLLLSKDFLKLVGIAILIASPLSWYLMHKWLQDFAYRVRISWTVFLLTFMMALLITLLTISFQALRAAFANPVKSLKAE